MTADFQKRPGLTELVEAVLRGEIAAIVLDTTCRLSRFGFEVYEHMFKYHGTETVIVNKVLGDPEYQAEQSDDIAEVLAKAKIDRLGE
jgi:predicted site-specific integrase-resolvase